MQVRFLPPDLKIVIMKKCTRCLVEKDKIDFPKSVSSKDKRLSYCKDCYNKEQVVKKMKRNEIDTSQYLPI